MVPVPVEECLRLVKSTLARQASLTAVSLDRSGGFVVPRSMHRTTSGINLEFTAVDGHTSRISAIATVGFGVPDGPQAPAILELFRGIFRELEGESHQ